MNLKQRNKTVFNVYGHVGYYGGRMLSGKSENDQFVVLNE